MVDNSSFKMCKADSSEILSSFEVVLPPSIVDTCHRMRPGISTCFLAVNKEEGTSSQITVAKQTDSSVVLSVSVMALGKSKREKPKPTRKTMEEDGVPEEGTEEANVDTSLEEMERFIKQARAHAEQLTGTGEQTDAPGPIRRKPGPAFTKKPGYVPGKSKKPKETTVTAVRNTYEKTSVGRPKGSAKKLITLEETKRNKAQRYVPSTKLKPKASTDSVEKTEGAPVINKQPGSSRFAKTQATLAAIEAANKKKPSYIGNLRSRRLPDMHVAPGRPRGMPVLQPVNDAVDKGKATHTSKAASGKMKRARPTQPYGQPRPTGMNKSLTKIWGSKKKRGGRRGSAGRGGASTKSNTSATEPQVGGEEEEDVPEPTPVAISASESTIVITVNDGKPSAPLQGTEILHHKKRWAAANTQSEETVEDAPEANNDKDNGEEEMDVEEGHVEDGDNANEEGEVTFTEAELEEVEPSRQAEAEEADSEPEGGSENGEPPEEEAAEGEVEDTAEADAPSGDEAEPEDSSHLNEDESQAVSHHEESDDKAEDS